MVIIEPRQHPDLQYTVENFHKLMPPHYQLYVFHGRSAGEYARHSVAGVVGRTVHFEALTTDNLGVDEYNNLLQQPDFWQSIDAEHVRRK